MSSSPLVDIIRHTDPDSSTFIRSHILHPHSEITVLCIISGEKDNVVSVLEDHLLESISSTPWNYGDEETDFAFITEKYNHFQHNLAETDRENVNALFAILKDEELMISVIWSMSAVLREKNGDLSIIAEDKESLWEFSALSSGKIPHGAQVYLSSKPLSTFLSDDFFDECAHMSHDAFASTVEGILGRDIHESIHIIRIIEKPSLEKKPSKLIASSRRMSHQIDIARGLLYQAKDTLIYNRKIQHYKEECKLFIEKKNTYFLVLFLIVGAILFFWLIYILLWALFQATNNPQIDIKNQILQAKTLIEESQKLTSNSEAFTKNIEAAEDILFKIRDKQEYMKDTQALLQRIEAMKKEMYDIQTIDLSKKTNIIAFNPTDISPLEVFESEKKLNLIGKNSAIFGYARGSVLPAVSTYPPGEEVIHVDMTDDGNFYFLTKNMRVLSTKRDEVTYVNVIWQESWERANRVRTFNNNIYLIDQLWWQIYKHKPGTNGFSQKSEVLPATLSGILDVGIDGWFYIMTDEPRIYRMISKEWYSQSGIILNKVPGEYSIGTQWAAQIVVKSNLNFIYILSDDRIWIFEPDSKRFQDVRSWTYLAQLEISTEEEIRSISVPRDWLIYTVTNLWVYEIPFEFVDKNIILKN